MLRNISMGKKNLPCSVGRIIDTCSMKVNDAEICFNNAGAIGRDAGVATKIYADKA
jgi:hypothetical protein